MTRIDKPTPAREWGIAFVFVLILGLLCVPVLARAAEGGARASCANNLKQMGLVFKMYSGEARSGELPPLSPWAYNWVPDVMRLIPDYLNPQGIVYLSCPGRGLLDPKETRPFCVDSTSYVYTRYPLISNIQAAAFRAAYDADPGAVHSGRPLNVKLPPEAQLPSSAVIAQSEIPLLWDRVPFDGERWSHRSPQGANVLFMDGHVEFQRIEDALFPITPLSGELFSEPPPRLPRECLF